MPRKIRFEAVYPYPPEEVWTALTNSAAMAEWLMPNDFMAVMGHKFQFRTKPAPGFSGIVECEVLALDAPKRLAFSWAGGGIDTVVSFDLAPLGTGTRLVMEQSGFKGMRGLMVSNILKSGWKRMIEIRLAAASARVRDGRYVGEPLAEELRCHTD